MAQYTKDSYTGKQYPAKLAPDAPAKELAGIAWLGDSREVLRAFPAGVQQDLGYALYQVQLGQMPPDSKPMKTVGPGVYELRDQDERAWYRVFYLKKIAGIIYVITASKSRQRKQSKRT